MPFCTPRQRCYRNLMLGILASFVATDSYAGEGVLRGFWCGDGANDLWFNAENWGENEVPGLNNGFSARIESGGRIQIDQDLAIGRLDVDGDTQLRNSLAIGDASATQAYTITTTRTVASRRVGPTGLTPTITLDAVGGNAPALSVGGEQLIIEGRLELRSPSLTRRAIIETNPANIITVSGTLAGSGNIRIGDRFGFTPGLVIQGTLDVGHLGPVNPGELAPPTFLEIAPVGSSARVVFASPFSSVINIRDNARLGILGSITGNSLAIPSNGTINFGNQSGLFVQEAWDYAGIINSTGGNVVSPNGVRFLGGEINVAAGGRFTMGANTVTFDHTINVNANGIFDQRGQYTAVATPINPNDRIDIVLTGADSEFNFYEISQIAGINVSGEGRVFNRTSGDLRISSLSANTVNIQTELVNQGTLQVFSRSDLLGTPSVLNGRSVTQDGGTIVLAASDQGSELVFDQIRVSDQINLNGRLVLSQFVSTLSPVPGQEYDLLQADGGIVGEFEITTLVGFDSFDLIPEFIYSADALRIRFISSILTGDYNGDGFVGQSDLDLVLLNFGSTTLPAGFVEASLPTGGVFDGTIGQQELDGVLLNFGSGSVSGAAASLQAVPEPASAALLVISGVGLLSLRRRAASRVA